jgi:hypothetical protein
MMNPQGQTVSGHVIREYNGRSLLNLTTRYWWFSDDKSAASLGTSVEVVIITLARRDILG